MNDLVINYNGTLATTQEKISVLTANNEQSIQKLIRTYKQDIEEFGELIFQNIQVQAGLGFTYKKVYFLNEQQATLILTYMKNTQQVRNAKKILVKAFFEMKKQLENKSSNVYQISGYKSQIAQHNKKIEELESKNKNLQAILNNLRLDYHFLLRKNGIKSDMPKLQETIEISPEQITSLIKKGLLYDKLNNETCELWSKYKDLQSKTNIILNNISELKLLAQ